MSLDPVPADEPESSAPVLRRGVVLPVWATLGHAPTSDHPSRGTEGNGFRTSWADDLEMLAEHGITDLRLTLDWPRLQPAPGRVDGDWVEWYRGVIEQAGALGMRTWCTLLERDVPRWFDDERGWRDERTAGRQWPRWVDIAADAVGDVVAGWFPIENPLGVADRAAQGPDGAVDAVRQGEVLDTLVVAWRDAWRVLRGGPPVVTALRVGPVRAVDQTERALQDARRREHLVWRLFLRGLRDGTVVIPGRADRELADLAGACDGVGVGLALRAEDLRSGRLTDDALAAFSDRLGEHVRRAAEEGPDVPLSVSSLRLRWAEPAERAHLVDAALSGLRDAAADGVPLQTVFVEPAVDDTGSITLL